ncbi:MAG: RluA family pseudouridine synthase [Candidatus Omnitrophica bacterium]|nr:RluA family pseudouridine synthase [Candidatus Omnitrophota bacterium]MCL4734465.1 RluA family pseudouridine synthase [Candidatus Omnitrophota bacterium]
MTSEEQAPLLVPGPEDEEKRIDLFLSERLPELSRTRLQDLISQGQVETSAGIVRKPSFRLRRIGWVRIHVPDPAASLVPAEDLPLEILFEDSDFAIVNKPAGMPTHPSFSRTSGTLVNALLFHLKDLSGIGGVLRPGIVHRLDRVTSGLLIIAKNQFAHEKLADQFRRRTVKKTYRALCLGEDPGESGIIEGLIGRHPIRRKKRVLGQEGRPSRTSYSRIFSCPPLYGLYLFPYTGRTHQLRTHLESLRCPIVLDPLYGYEPQRWPYPKFNPLLKSYPGIFLHAEKLEFHHPREGIECAFSVPPPQQFQLLWDALNPEGKESR